MTKNVVALVGSYRKGGITDQTVDAVLDAARQKGARTDKIYLTEKTINFCLNCRKCCQEKPEQRRGQCVQNDDMAKLLDAIDAADAVILASPINFFTVTAVMKRFVERLMVYGYWPWQKAIPRNRIKTRNKKAVLVTSSACPAFIGQFLMTNAKILLKSCAELVGAKVVKSVYFGSVAMDEKQRLNARQLGIAMAAGRVLV